MHCLTTIFNTFYPHSSRIHEEDYRQIQTNVPFLAPEILAVFANSQIFHDSQPTKSLAIVHKSPAIHEDQKKHTRTDSDSEKKLLKRLEGNSFDWTFQIQATNRVWKFGKKVLFKQKIDICYIDRTNTHQKKTVHQSQNRHVNKCASITNHRHWYKLGTETVFKAIDSKVA